LLWFLGALQLSVHEAVFRTVARIDREAAVGPQLPLGDCDASVKALKTNRTVQEFDLFFTHSLKLHLIKPKTDSNKINDLWAFGCAENDWRVFRPRRIENHLNPTPLRRVL
jgi:hypothetical protein